MDPMMDSMTAYHGGYSQTNSPQSPGSPGSNSNSPAKKPHSRTYQACIACRKRKVKCDMGDVENPHAPPCARCKRERKPCEFDNTRRKANGKRAQSEFDDLDDGYQQPLRPPKRPRQPDNSQMLYNNGTSASPLTPGTYHALSPASYPHSPVIDPEAIDRSTNAMKKETYDGKNALSALVEAADMLTKKPRDEVPGRSISGGEARQGKQTGVQEPAYPPEVIQEAIRKHWSRFRFVKAGLISAQEAMAYIDYFYTECMPFTPVCIPDYRDPSLHQILLDREPFLLITILTIASRFMALKGHGGAKSRPHEIHERFWMYLQKMFNTLNWAQEQFGGGFSGGGKANAGPSLDPLHRYGIRSITTVESLMLLCEWAPRALHFPPGDDDGLLVSPLASTVEEEELADDRQRLLNGFAGERRDSWLEPAWRCDKMIWMLLHNAKALALEIGLFDDRTEADLLQTTFGVPHDEIRAYHIRKTKTKETFWAFYVQTCGRLEIIGKLPRGYLESLHQSESDKRIKEVVAARANAFDQGLEHPHAPIAHIAPYYQDQNEATWFFWQEITAIMKSGNETVFSKTENTRAITRSGEYRKWIQIYSPLLQEWRTEFDKCDLVPEPMRTILLIEYEYVRIYIHTLALHAFVERAVASTPSKQNLEVPENGDARNDSAASNGGHGVALEDVRKWMQEDEPYLHTLVEACQHVLSLIGESAIPAEKIKHFTVRVYFRIMGSAVHLLKTYYETCDEIIDNHLNATDHETQSFVVGAYADNVRRSFDLLEKASHTLQNNIVDDVHIGAVFSEMIDNVSKQLCGRLKRFAPGSRPGRSRAQSGSPTIARSPVLRPTNGLPASLPPSGLNSYSGNGHGFNTPALNGDQFLDWQNDHGSLINNLEVYDTSNASNMTVMPPPNFFNGQFDTGGDDGSANGMANGTNGFMTNPIADWVAMEMDPLVSLATNGQQNEVSNTHFGPQINGLDMLDHFRFSDTTGFDQSQAHGLPMVHPNSSRMWARS